MTEYRKGDVCSLEVVVQAVLEDRAVVGIAECDDPYTVPQDYLTLLRRAPVDLATCELPQPVSFRDGSNTGVMRSRFNEETGHLVATVQFDDGTYGTYLVESLRPIDSHAPESEVDRLRASIAEVLTTLGTKYHATAVTKLMDELAGTAPTYTLDAPAPDKGEVARLRAALEGIRQYGLDTMSGRVDGPDDRAWQRAAVVEMTKRARLALNPDATSTAPTCPPGHIMIGDRAVPEPMREVPRMGQPYWRVCADQSALAMRWEWDGRSGEVMWLQRGLIHSTEANARAHAEAIIALSAGEGV